MEFMILWISVDLHDLMNEIVQPAVPGSCWNFLSLNDSWLILAPYFMKSRAVDLTPQLRV